MTHSAVPAQVRSAFRSRFTLAVVAAALLVSAGCGGGAGPSAVPTGPGAATTARPTDSGPTSANPVTLTIGTTGGITNAPMNVGVEKGLYLKHGIDLKIALVPTPPDVVKGLQANVFQFSATTWSGIGPAVSQGVPFRVVALTTGRPNVANYDDLLAIIVRPGVTAKTVAELKGSKIAVALGGNPETYVRLLLAKAGLDPSKDVTLVNVPTGNQVAALQRGDVDAASMSEPSGTQAELQLTGSRVLVRGGGVLEGRAFVAALDSWVKQNPVLLDHFLAGHYEAEQYVRQHPGDTGVALSHYISGVDLAVITASLQKAAYDPRWSSLVQAGFESSSQAMVASGAIKAAPNPADILVLDLLTSAEKKYPEYFNDLK